MTAIRAHIENGTVVLDEPIDLPNGTPVMVSVSNDADPFVGMDAEERAELEAALDEGSRDIDNGDYVDGIEFAKNLLAGT